MSLVAIKVGLWLGKGSYQETSGSIDQKGNHADPRQLPVLSSSLFLLHVFLLSVSLHVSNRISSSLSEFSESEQFSTGSSGEALPVTMAFIITIRVHKVLGYKAFSCTKNLPARPGCCWRRKLPGIRVFIRQIYVQNYLNRIASFCVTASIILSKENISNNTKHRRQISKFQWMPLNRLRDDFTK